MIELDLHPDAPTLRHFGFIALAGFALLAGLVWTDSLIFASDLGTLVMLGGSAAAPFLYSLF